MRIREATTRLLHAVMLLVVVASFSLVAIFGFAKEASAVSFVQTKNATASATTASVAFSPAATAGALLVIICSVNAASTISVPTGYTTAISETTDPSQAIFYKIAAGGETTQTCTFGTSATDNIQIFEYSGAHSYTPVDVVSAGGSTGSTTTASTGNVVTLHASDVLVAGVISDANTTPTTWTSSFTSRNGFTVGGSPTKRAGVASADRIVSATGTYSSTVTVGSGNWRGQVVAFKSLAASPSLGTDIVTGAGASVTSPSASLGAAPRSFACQTTTGSLGTASTQIIRTTNNTDNPAWTLAISATSGPSATWTAGANTYKFNDATASGCTNGQMTVDATAGTVSAATNCSATSGITKGSSASFVNGTVNAVTLMTATSPANIDCYWDMIGVSLSQKVPANQPSGSYSLNLTITVTAN